MFKLKTYQQRAVDCLESFLLNCQTLPSVEEAYSKTMEEQSLPELGYRDYGFEQTPYVCLRIPTGGGKTILGSYAIDIAARKYVGTDAPITLWLVPTNTIRLQTVEALKTPGHPYRAKLDETFNHQVLVLDIDEVTQIRPQDIGSKAIVIVSTLANLRVTDTSGRKVYAYHENFEPHFSKIPSSHPSMPLLERVTEGDLKENAEYHAQREAQGMLQAKIYERKGRLSRALIIDPSKVPKDEIAFGATVTVIDMDLDEEEKITLVGDGDEDYDNGKYLITSPLGKGLLGKKAGDVVDIPVPKGTLKFKVVAIAYE